MCVFFLIGATVVAVRTTTPIVLHCAVVPNLDFARAGGEGGVRVRAGWGRLHQRSLHDHRITALE